MKNNEKILIGGIVAVLFLGLIGGLLQHSEFYNRLYDGCKQTQHKDIAFAMIDCRCVARQGEKMKNKMGISALTDLENWEYIGFLCTK